MSSSSEDPSYVWKTPEVADTFTDIRDSVPLNQEQLDLMTRIIRTFLQKSEKGRICSQDNQQERKKENSFTWLDLGCGDGPLSRKLLEEFPNANGVLMDFSLPMLEHARTKMAQLEYQSRVTILQGDLSRSDWMEALKKRASSNEEKEPVIDVVVSSFAIHHLSNERKRELYQEIFNILSPGGVFLNLEHVASPDETVEGIFDGAFVDSMYKTFGGAKTLQECEKAVHYDLNVDDEANILVPVEIQCDWLRDIGFHHVDCYFKYLILALFGGVKK